MSYKKYIFEVDNKKDKPYKFRFTMSDPYDSFEHFINVINRATDDVDVFMTEETEKNNECLEQ